MKRRNAILRELDCLLAGTLGIPRRDLLQARLAHGLRQAPAGFSLELTLDAEDRLAVIELPPEPAAVAAIEAEARLRAGAMAKEQDELATEEAHQKAQRARSRSAIDAWTGERLRALGSGRALPAASNASPRSVPSRLAELALDGTALAILGADGLNIGVPLADALGVDVKPGLWTAVLAQPVLSSFAGVAGFAVAGAMGVGFLWLIRIRLPPGANLAERIGLALRRVGVGVAVTGTSCAVARLRHGVAAALSADRAGAEAAAGGVSWPTWAVVTAAACFLAAWLHARARVLGARRRQRLEERLASESRAGEAADEQSRLAEGERILTGGLATAEVALSRLAVLRRQLDLRAGALLAEVAERLAAARRRDLAFARAVREDIEAHRVGWQRYAPRPRQRSAPGPTRGGLFGLVVLTVLAASACNPTTPRPPLRQAVITDQPVARSAVAAEALEGWLADDGPGRPLSSFEVYALDPDGSARRAFSACTPKAWGAGVAARRAAFARAARERLAASGAASAPACAPGPGTNLLVEVAGLQTRPQRAAGPVHFVLVCDRSSSGQGPTQRSCDEATAVSAYAGWLSRAPAGSTFELLVVGSDRASVRSLFRERVGGHDAGEVARLLGRRTGLRALSTAGGGSDIANAVQVAAEILAQRQGSRELLVASDGRQRSAQVRPRGANPLLPALDLERQVPPPARFVEALARRGLAPRLAGLSLRWCGVHFESGPGTAPQDARAAAELRAAWRAWLAAAGAPDIDLRADCEVGAGP